MVSAKVALVIAKLCPCLFPKRAQYSTLASNTTVEIVNHPISGNFHELTETHTIDSPDEPEFHTEDTSVDEEGQGESQESLAWARDVAEALKRNSTTKSLDQGKLSASHLKLLFDRLSIRQTEIICEGLSANTSITTVEFGCNGFKDSGAVAVAEAMKSNGTVTSLSLWGNGVRDKGAAALASALRFNSSIRILLLGNNEIGDKGLSSLAEQALKVNSSLVHLDLSVNGMISDEGAVTLAEALAVNSGLTQLNLSNDSIGNEGATAIAEALTKNSRSALKILDLSFNMIEDPGVKALAKMLRTNTTILELSVNGNIFADEGKYALEQALAHSTVANRKLKIDDES